MSDILLEQSQKLREKDALYWKVFQQECVSGLLEGGVLKDKCFHLLRKKNYLKLKSWLNFNAITVFYKIKKLLQFSEKKSR